MFLIKRLAIMAVLGLIAVYPCHAEPGKAVAELLQEPGMSLFERGMKSIETSVHNVVRLEPLQNERIKGPPFEWLPPSVYYDAATDQLQLNFRMKTEDRDRRKRLCQNAVNYIKEMLTAGWDPDDPSDVTFVGAAFRPYRMNGKQEYSPAVIRRSRYMDSIAHIDVVVQTGRNPHDFTQCRSPLTADDMSIREFPPVK